jgi:hypothetical protein
MGLYLSELGEAGWGLSIMNIKYFAGHEDEEVSREMEGVIFCCKSIERKWRAHTSHQPPPSQH